MILTGEKEGRKSIVVSCECNASEHELRFDYFPEDREIILSTFLNFHTRWYRRIWPAIRYIFGYKSIYGHFDNTLLDPATCQKLAEFLKQNR